MNPAKLAGQESSFVIELAHLTRSYDNGKRVLALDNVSLRVRASERVAVTGPSGSGKSTLLNLICGLDRPTYGSVTINGSDLSQLSDDARTRLRREKIGMIFQTFNLLPTLTATENVALPLRLQGLSKKESTRRAASMLERVGLADRTIHRPDEMSGGERQRVAIARALIFKPVLLLGDEPTGNLDSVTGGDVLRLLDELQQEYGSTLLIVTHNAEVAGYCDRIVTLHDGKVIRDHAANHRAEGRP